MNKLLLTILLGFVILFPLTTQAAFAGEGGGGFSKQPVTFGKVTVDPVANRGIEDTSFTLHYQDKVTFTRDTSMDCTDDMTGEFVPPTSVILNAGPFFDNWDVGIEAANFFIPSAFALASGDSISVPMLPTGNPNEVSAMIGPLSPSHGNGPISFDVTCPPGSSNTAPDVFFDVFVDPSGLVLDACTNEPIQGAEIVLSVDRGFGFEFFIFEFFDNPIPIGQGIIIPNDGGSQLSNFDGSYGWDVAVPPAIPSGYDWQVTVQFAPGYQVPVTLGPYTINVPEDEVTDANFFLVPLEGCPAIGGNLLPIDSTALVLAGFQSSAMWILPIAFAGAGFAAFKLKKYWN